MRRGLWGRADTPIGGRARGAVIGCLMALAACGDPAAKAAAEQQAQRTSMAAAETTARAAAALPATGLWSEAHLMDRLVRTGVAPRASEAAAPQAPWMGKAPIVLTAGGSDVYAWIYADSAARKAVTDRLDSLSATPPGETTPFAPPMVFVTNNNLAVVVSGGRVTNHERIMLALQAGLPVRP